MVPGNGKCSRDVSGFDGFLRSGGGVVNGVAAVQSFLKIYGKFADIVQLRGIRGFFLCPERCGKRTGQLCGAGKVFIDGLSAGPVFTDVGKHLHKDPS